MDSILQRLTELDEITSALLIGRDGLIVAGSLQSDDEEVLSAMAAALVGSIADFTAQTGNSEMRHAILETEKGTIQFAEVGDLILIVKTNGTGNLGRVRTEMKRTSRKLSELVATY